MEYINDRESDKKAAEELAEMLVSLPSPFKSLNLDHPSLVDRLAELMPAISAFSRCTCVLMEEGEIEEARLGIDAFSRKFSEALNMSEDDGRWFCVFLVSMTMLIKKVLPVYSLMAEKKWEEWLQKIWGKES